MRLVSFPNKRQRHTRKRESLTATERRILSKLRELEQRRPSGKGDNCGAYERWEVYLDSSLATARETDRQLGWNAHLSPDEQRDLARVTDSLVTLDLATRDDAPERAGAILRLDD